MPSLARSVSTVRSPQIVPSVFALHCHARLDDVAEKKSKFERSSGKPDRIASLRLRVSGVLPIRYPGRPLGRALSAAQTFIPGSLRVCAFLFGAREECGTMEGGLPRGKPDEGD